MKMQVVQTLSVHINVHARMDFLVTVLAVQVCHILKITQILRGNFLGNLRIFFGSVQRLIPNFVMLKTDSKVITIIR